MSPKACCLVRRARADLKMALGEPTAQRALWEGPSFSSSLSLAAMEMRDVPLAGMPGYLSSSFLSKRRLKQEAPLDRIWSLARECALPCSLPRLTDIFSTPLYLYSAQVSPEERRGPAAFWQRLSPELPTPGWELSPSLAGHGSMQHRALSFLA